MSTEVYQTSIREMLQNVQFDEWELDASFQRGQRWTIVKKQRLIDSVFRGWIMPPIYLSRDEDTYRHTVLDGRQRVGAIRDFMSDIFPVNSSIEPLRDENKELDKLYYSQLPSYWKRIFDRYIITVVLLRNQKSEDVAEMYLRLNDGTRLTASELRNAYHGPVKNQVRDLVVSLEGHSMPDARYSNGNRGGYEDVIAQVVSVMLNGTLWKRVTSTTLTEMYRSERKIPKDFSNTIDQAISLIGPAMGEYQAEFKFSKASLFSWLLFAVRLVRQELQLNVPLHKFLYEFESLRQEDPTLRSFRNSRIFRFSKAENFYNLLDIYSHRCRSKIWDPSSVVLRDLVLWILFLESHAGKLLTDRDSISYLTHEISYRIAKFHLSDEEILLDSAKAVGWGEFV